MELFHLKSRLSKKKKKRGKKQFNALVAIVIHLVGHDRRIINPLYQTQRKINQNRDGFNGSNKLVVPATVFERQLTLRMLMVILVRTMSPQQLPQT